MAKLQQRRGARPVGDLVSQLLDPVLARKAGMTTGLIAAWSELVGTKLDGVCRPDKLVWPPRLHEADAFKPATLVVACEGASVLRLQHQTSEVIARVNAFFGYPAIDRLKIVQRSVRTQRPDRRPVLRTLKPSELSDIAEMTDRIEDPRLKAALAAFGAGILQRRPMTKA
ncbi:hypothetical protein Sa4125_06580 [Aureimonas sp. SA4125]|uniref:DUF721 domain-containing protein n=1 Tax=Aureimonas sp. SA4125 TaxID=2826993 RepID=UPI001CC4571F|nr:DciA family protein [Aureimonas sp. SA4125]BDA83116.1 hypothetical protein Sa4125_06580 [Aureimonas sp. SA4125]